MNKQTNMKLPNYFFDRRISKNVINAIPGRPLFPRKAGSETSVKVSYLLFLLLFLPLLVPHAFAQGHTGGAYKSSEKAVLQQIITRMPAQDAGEFNLLNRQLVDLGPRAWHTLTAMLVPPGTGDDTYARYALNSMAKYVSRPGAESLRQSFEQVILEAVQSDIIQPSDKIFLMAQLELAGSNTSVEVLRSFLDEEKLCGPAARALTGIGTREAFQAVRKAIPGATPGQQAVLIKTIGDAKMQEAAGELMPYAKSDHAPVKSAARYALAQTGNPLAASAFQNSAFRADSYPAIKHTSLRILYARRLLEEGHGQESRSICRDLLNGNAPAHVKNDALSLLVDQEGAGAMDEVIRASTGDDPQLRTSALETAAKLGDTNSTRRWTLLLSTQSPEVRADILTMLGRRGDKKALADLTDALKDENREVRLAAVDASAKLGGAAVIPDLVHALINTGHPREIAVIKAALLRLPTDKVTRSVARNLDRGTVPSRVAMLEILGERRASSQRNSVFDQIRSADMPVRMAALKALDQVAVAGDLSRMVDLLPRLDESEESRLLSELQKAIGAVAAQSPEPEKSAEIVLKKINRTDGAQKARLLRILPHLPTATSLEMVINNTQSSNDEVKAAAVSALAGWPYATAAEPLLQFLRHSGDIPLRQTALKGYVRLVGELKFSSRDKVNRFAHALEAAQNASEKQIILSGLSGVRTSSAVELAARHFRDPGVQDQALQTAAHILATQTDPRNPLNSADIAAALSESLNGETIPQKLKGYIADERRKMEEARAFTTLFNGKDLTGWTGATDAYEVEDGHIVTKPGTHGNLYTEEPYGDFVFRFEFKLTPGANSGLGIRAPLEGDAAYQGMEIQILDNTADKYAGLHTYQYHGSIYGVVPAKRGYLKPVGDWNEQEVIARGSHITVNLNGETIVDVDLDTVHAMDGRDHPGLHRPGGHIGFLGHGDQVFFRNIRIKNLNTYAPTYAASGSAGRKMNEPPEGFKALFNGRNLEGWKGLVGNPETRPKMSDEELDRKQVQADSVMRKHWTVRDGILYFDGKGESLTTEKDYGDFEMLVDWKIDPHGDSGIYLRGSPQVQIWDITEWPQGSGGLYNNTKHPSEPMTAADHPIGEWNRFRIQMINDRVTVYLNSQLVVSNVVLENYWNRDKPIYSTGQIELQSHTTPLYFKNIFIREFPRAHKLFNGKDLTGWERVGGRAGRWQVDDGVLSTEGGGEKWNRGMGGGWLSTAKQYDNFTLELEYRLPEGGNSGIFLRAPHQGDPAFAGMEIQLLDDDADKYAGLEAWQYTGSIYDVQAPGKRAGKKAGEWQKMTIVCDGPNVQVALNGEKIINTSLIDHMDRVEEHPGLKRRTGYIGLQNHNTKIEFRNITITEIK